MSKMPTIRRLNRLQVFASQFKRFFMGGVQNASSLPYIPYGVSEDYYDQEPQLWIKLFKDSGTIRECVKAYARVIYGGGFKVQSFMDMKVNEDGLLCGDLLEMSCTDYALFHGLGTLVNLNAFNKVCNVYHANFEKIRLGLPDSKDRIKKIAIVNRYDNEMYGVYPSDYYQPIWHDAFNLDRGFLYKRYEESGGIENYKGQILYTAKNEPGARYYPDPVFIGRRHDGLSESIISENLQYDIDDRFKPTAIITEYGKQSTSKKEKEDIISDYEGYSHSDSPRFIVRLAQNKNSKLDVDVIESPDVTKHYEFAETSRQNNIRRSFSFPDVIYGIALAGKLGQTNEIESSIAYANTLVEQDRQKIIRHYKKVFSNFYGIEFYNPDMDFSMHPFDMFGRKPSEEKTEQTEAIASEMTERKDNELSNLLKVASEVNDSVIKGLANGIKLNKTELKIK